MQGSLSLDFLLSIIVTLVIASVLFGMAFMQIEQASAVSMKYRAEAMAMGVGSAINHFYAIDSEDPSKLTIDFSGRLQDASGKYLRAGGIGGIGWNTIALDPMDCTVTVTGNTVNVTIGFYRMENNFQEYVSATYPIVPVKGEAVVQCDSRLEVNQDMEVSAA
ncbi:MAG: hypothetical protein JW834_01895 [Candidatus Diapherotrites archaeon]|nr:hypothetical protein [Candidatus Diapherotrites archaeon]